jgi:hypothetical protein
VTVTSPPAIEASGAPVWTTSVAVNESDDVESTAVPETSTLTRSTDSPVPTIAADPVDRSVRSWNTSRASVTAQSPASSTVAGPSPTKRRSALARGADTTWTPGPSTSVSPNRSGSAAIVASRGSTPCAGRPSRVKIMGWLPLRQGPGGAAGDPARGARAPSPRRRARSRSGRPAPRGPRASPSAGRCAAPASRSPDRRRRRGRRSRRPSRRRRSRRPRTRAGSRGRPGRSPGRSPSPHTSAANAFTPASSSSQSPAHPRTPSWSTS